MPKKVIPCERFYSSLKEGTPMTFHSFIAAVSVFLLTAFLVLSAVLSPAGAQEVGHEPRGVLQPPSFVVGSPVTAAKGSGQAHLVDMNHDGHLDLVMKHLTNRTVSVLRGDGKGHFVTAPEYSLKLSIEPGAIAVGDVNNDGLPDLAVNSKQNSDERIHIFLSHASGGFDPSPGPPLPAGVSTENCCYKPKLRFIDINKDGNLDLISSNGRRGTLEVFPGNGRGGFSVMPSLKLEPARRSYTFELAEMDNDETLDLVVASSNAPESEAGLLWVRRGDGKGGFPVKLGKSWGALPDPHVELVADLNGDQHPDILLRHGEMNRLSLFLNKGNGLLMPAPNSPMDLGMPASSVITTDVDGDKNADLIVATVAATAPFESRIVVLLGDGHGGFKSAPGSPFPAGPGTYGFAVGDIDENGKLDIVASSFESSAVTILLGR
jgi:hypothetical protein